MTLLDMPLEQPSRPMEDFPLIANEILKLVH